MKSLNLILIVFALIFCMNFTANATGNYVITPVESLSYGKDIEKAWTLSYGNDEAIVTVLKKMSSKGVNYIVRSKFFEVCYASGTKGFGIQALNRNDCTVPQRISSAILNEEEMEKQKIITTEKISDDYALGLIANYLPELINENYSHLLN